MYYYVGPDNIRERADGSQCGKPVTSLDNFIAVINDFGEEFEEEMGWMTYIIDLEGQLILSPRRMEHIVCSGGNPVLGAGEIKFDRQGKVVELTNNSTGFCPDIKSWKEVADALDEAGLSHPDNFTSKMIFRLCPDCGERNIVKDSRFYCEICGAELPPEWNIE